MFLHRWEDFVRINLPSFSFIIINKGKLILKIILYESFTFVRMNEKIQNSYLYLLVSYLNYIFNLPVVQNKTFILGNNNFLGIKTLISSYTHNDQNILH